MADDGGQDPGTREEGPESRLDLRDVRKLVRLMDRHGLAEVELEDAGRRVRLRKGHAAEAPALQAVPLHAPGPVPGPALPAAAAPSTPQGVEIRSPMVGTLYRATSPEAAPLVEVGDTVRKDTVVCIIEAMKVMNEIKAEVEGVVLAVLAQNGEAVEFDQPLFLVKPAAGAPAGD